MDPISLQFVEVYGMLIQIPQQPKKKTAHKTAEDHIMYDGLYCVCCVTDVFVQRPTEVLLSPRRSLFPKTPTARTLSHPPLKLSLRPRKKLSL